MDEQRLTKADIAAIDEALIGTIMNDETGFVLWSSYSHLPVHDMVAEALRLALAATGLESLASKDVDDVYYGGRMEITALLAVKIGERVMFIACDSDKPQLVTDPSQLPSVVFS